LTKFTAIGLPKKEEQIAPGRGRRDGEVEPAQCPGQALSEIVIINAAGFLTLQAIGAAERQHRVTHTETVATETELMQRLPNRDIGGRQAR
jgi:hypothetical protein